MLLWNNHPSNGNMFDSKNIIFFCMIIKKVI